VPLDKDEGFVKAHQTLAVREHRSFLPERLRTKTLEDSRCITIRGRFFAPPTIDTAINNRP